MKQDTWGCLLHQVQACGHRVVHGKDIPRALLVSPEVERQIEDAASLAPLHNPPNLEGIRAAARIFVGKPQVRLMTAILFGPQTDGVAWTPQAHADESSHVSALPCIQLAWCKELGGPVIREAVSVCREPPSTPLNTTLSLIMAGAAEGSRHGCWPSGGVASGSLPAHNQGHSMLTQHV